MRQVLDTVRRDPSGRVAMMRQTLEMRDSSQAVDGDNNGFVNIPLAAAEVKAVIYMREVGADKFRVSLRSKGDINVSKVAEKFGGGGHKNVSGLAIEGSWGDAEKRLLDAVVEAVDRVEPDWVSEAPDID